jgi:hypothetical protein
VAAWRRRSEAFWLALVAVPGAAQPAPPPSTSPAPAQTEVQPAPVQSGMARLVRCDSPPDGAFRRCRERTGMRVRLVETHAGTCRQTVSWGHDLAGIWVKDGCSATFAVGRGQLPAPAAPARTPPSPGLAPAPVPDKAFEGVTPPQEDQPRP